MSYVRSAALTHPGRQRPNNEDFITFFEPIDPEVLRKSGCLYILADGVGGASKGERASQYAAQKILHDFYKYSEIPVEERLRTIIRQAGNDIFDYAQSQDNFMQMATTIVVAVIRNGTLQVAHVGDSRAYLVHDGQVSQITRDHSTVGELMRDGLLNEEEAMHFDGRNPLSRSLGGQRDVPVDVTDPIPFIPGDQILLSSDGLTRYASRKNINDLLKQGEPDDVVYRMIDYANQSGGVDNISVIIIEALDKAIAPSSPKGQKPTPVDWETVPTIPESFLYRDKKYRKKTVYPGKKKATKLPYLLAGFGLVFLTIIFVVLGWQLMNLSGNRMNNTTEPPVSEAEIVVTLVETEDLEIEHETELVEITEAVESGSVDEYSMANTEEADIGGTDLNPTPEVSETPINEPVSNPDQIGWCTYTINFNNLNIACVEHDYGGCENEYPPNTSWKSMDLFCLVKCKFPAQFSQWDPIDIQDECNQYAGRIDKLNSNFLGEKNRTLEHGWTLRFPDITNQDCVTAGGDFELDD